MEKKCVKCNEVKDIGEFYKHRSQCKTCKSNYQKQYRKDNRDKQALEIKLQNILIEEDIEAVEEFKKKMEKKKRDYHRAYYEKNKDLLLEYQRNYIMK